MTTEEKLFKDAAEYSAWMQSRNNREHELHVKAEEEAYNRHITEMRVEELEKEAQVLKEHHQRDEALIVQRTTEIKHLEDQLNAHRKLGGNCVETRMAREIATLKAWIRFEGERSDTCTHDILREVCQGCRCPRGYKSPEQPAIAQANKADSTTCST